MTPKIIGESAAEPIGIDEAALNLLMVSKSEQPRLLAALEASPTWCSAYSDEVAVIYLRNINGSCGRK